MSFSIFEHRKRKLEIFIIEEFSVSIKVYSKLFSIQGYLVIQLFTSNKAIANIRLEVNMFTVRVTYTLHKPN
jgi:hypothetical protein